MVAETLYAIARNASGRPTLQHKLPVGVGTLTACGTNMEVWSISYQNTPIPSVLCRKDQCRS